MNVMEDIANVIRIGDCVVMGVGVASEKYRSLLTGATSQDYLLFGTKDSKDADYIASRMSGELPEPRSISVLDMKMNLYFIKSEKVKS